MERPDFILFSRSEEYRYELIIDKSVTQLTEFNFNNQYSSTLAPLVRPNGGPWGSLNI
jgi:hypothetical protein